MKLRDIRVLTAHLNGDVELFIRNSVNITGNIEGLAQVELSTYGFFGQSIPCLIMNTPSSKEIELNEEEYYIPYIFDKSSSSETSLELNDRMKILQKMMALLMDLKIGDKLKLKYQSEDWWTGIVTQDEDGSIDIIESSNRSAGYSCKDVVDLIACLIADFNENLLKDIGR